MLTWTCFRRIKLKIIPCLLLNGIIIIEVRRRFCIIFFFIFIIIIIIFFFIIFFFVIIILVITFFFFFFITTFIITRSKKLGIEYFERFYLPENHLINESCIFQYTTNFIDSIRTKTITWNTYCKFFECVSSKSN